MFGARIVTEIFFKWHGFTLECLGFLADALGWLLAAMQAGREVRDA